MAESLRCPNCGGYQDASIDPTGCTCRGNERARWASYHAGETYCCPTCGQWKDGSNRPTETRFRPCDDCARDTSTDCREILADPGAIPGPLDIHNCPGCGVSNLYSADGLPVEPVNPCKCSVGEDCRELEIPGDLMARLNAEFDAIARRRAELATIRVSVDIAGYSALRNGGRSIERWNGGQS